MDGMDVSENSGTPKSFILIGFSIINHPFWGSPIFGNTRMGMGFLLRTSFLGTSETRPKGEAFADPIGLSKASNWAGGNWGQKNRGAKVVRNSRGQTVAVVILLWRFTSIGESDCWDGMIETWNKLLTKDKIAFTLLTTPFVLCQVLFGGWPPKHFHRFFQQKRIFAFINKSKLVKEQKSFKMEAQYVESKSIQVQSSNRLQVAPFSNQNSRNKGRRKRPAFASGKNYGSQRFSLLWLLHEKLHLCIHICTWLYMIYFYLHMYVIHVLLYIVYLYMY